MLARRDARNVARLRGELGDQPLLLVPHLDDDVHDVEGLLRVHRYLFASDAERERADRRRHRLSRPRAGGSAAATRR